MVRAVLNNRDLLMMGRFDPWVRGAQTLQQVLIGTPMGDASNLNVYIWENCAAVKTSLPLFASFGG